MKRSKWKRGQRVLVQLDSNAYAATITMVSPAENKISLAFDHGATMELNLSTAKILGRAVDEKVPGAIPLEETAKYLKPLPMDYIKTNLPIEVFEEYFDKFKKINEKYFKKS